MVDCLDLCDVHGDECKLAMYSESKKKCKIFAGDGPMFRTTAECTGANDGWVLLGKVHVPITPNGGGSGGDLLLSADDVDEWDLEDDEATEQSETGCYLWTDLLVGMIEDAEDESGQQTDFLPEVGSRVSAETLALLPNMIDGVVGVEEFVKYGYLKRCPST